MLSCLPFSQAACSSFFEKSLIAGYASSFIADFGGFFNSSISSSLSLMKLSGLMAVK